MNETAHKPEVTYVEELIPNGPATYPDASEYVVHESGERIDIHDNKRADAFVHYSRITKWHLINEK